MLKIGLTGGIACGKTVVRRRFEERGIPTLDADAVVHGLFGAATDVTREIAATFGAEVLAPDGSVDRKRLGRIVFADPEERKKLESIVHPRVQRAIDRFFEGAERAGQTLAVVDAALMVETGSFRRYDRLVVVACRPDQQRDRLQKRDRLSAEDAQNRISAQMPVEEKQRFADYVVDTSGSMEETMMRTDEVIEELRKKA